MIREPAVSGQFYPATAAGLQKDILKYLEKGASLQKLLDDLLFQLKTPYVANTGLK